MQSRQYVCADSYGDLSQPHLPCLIIEVSYSQTFDNLRQLAESYIADSYAAIRCVIGLNLQYPSQGAKVQRMTRREKKRATVTIWRAEVEESKMAASTSYGAEIMTAEFRDRNGAACSGAMTLHIDDLLPPATIPKAEVGFIRGASIEIPFAFLNSSLSAAEGKTTNRTNATCVKTSAVRFAKRQCKLQSLLPESKMRPHCGRNLLRQGTRQSPRRKKAVV